MGKPKVWLFGILKGGARKSTSAIFCAYACAEAGEKVLLIDADAGTQGVTDWASRLYANGDDEMPFYIRQWAHSEGLLVPWIKDQIKTIGAVDRVLVDVGAEYPQVLAQAAMMADLVIAPCGPEQSELSRLEPTRSLLMRDGAPPLAVLLTRVPSAGKGIAKSVRDVLESSAFYVLPVEIPHNREQYAHVWGTSLAGELVDGIQQYRTGEYGPLVDHLRKVEQV